MADFPNTTPTPTRRTLLLGSAAALVTGITAARAAVPLDADMTGPLVAADDELVALERHWLAMQPEIRSMDDRWSEALHAAIGRMDERSIDANLDLFTGYIREVGYSEEDEARSSSLQREEGDTERRIMDLPAAGVVGLAVKLRMLARNMRQDRYDHILDMSEEDLDWTNLLAIRVLRDAERLAGEVRA